MQTALSTWVHTDEQNSDEAGTWQLQFPEGNPTLHPSGNDNVLKIILHEKLTYNFNIISSLTILVSYCNLVRSTGTRFSLLEFIHSNGIYEITSGNS